MTSMPSWAYMFIQHFPLVSLLQVRVQFLPVLGTTPPRFKGKAATQQPHIRLGTQLSQQSSQFLLSNRLFLEKPFLLSPGYVPSPSLFCKKFINYGVTIDRSGILVRLIKTLWILFHSCALFWSIKLSRFCIIPLRSNSFECCVILVHYSNRGWYDRRIDRTLWILYHPGALVSIVIHSKDW